jgi:hypothetical protein
MSEQAPESMTEQERRALAYQHRGEVADDPGEAVEPRRMPQMVSLRLDGEILGSLRDIANERGVSLSDLLREGADYVIAAWEGSRRSAHIRYVSSVWPGRSFSGSYDVRVQIASGFVTETRSEAM